MKNFIYKLWVNLMDKSFKALGLWLILLFVVSVSTWKFEKLRVQKDSMPTSYVSMEERKKQLECLTRNIYWESASEPFEGKVAVAQVTLNRLEAGKFGSTVCNVVYAKNVVYEKVICQFSWFCEGAHKLRPINNAMWKESEDVAKKVMYEGFRLPSLTSALYYHADYVNPGWHSKVRLEKIGRHIFYGEKS